MASGIRPYSITVSNSEAQGMVLTINGKPVTAEVSSLEIIFGKNGYRLSFAEFTPDPSDKKASDQDLVGAAKKSATGQYL